jgi:hypothetical protein
MDAERDWEGNPIQGGRSQPIAIDIDPVLNLP